MGMTLPPSIRPYWSTLTAEKAAAPEHREWEWSPDPFAAKKEVEERQAKRKGKEMARLEAAVGSDGSRGATPATSGRGTPVHGPDGKMWEGVPEVRMAPSLREKIEGVIKKVAFPDRKHRVRKLNTLFIR